MHISLLSVEPGTETEFLVLFYSSVLPDIFTKPEKQIIDKQILTNNTTFIIHRSQSIIYIIKTDNTDNSYEWFRKKGADTANIANSNKISTISVNCNFIDACQSVAFAEGFALAGYRFTKYFTGTRLDKNRFIPQQIDIYNNNISPSAILELNNTIKSVFWARDMVNEPVSIMNAVRFSQEVSIRGQEAGFDVEIYDKAKIESLKMGGILAVNRGSIDPPTFTIANWKPANATNNKPIVLVGKGVMFDTGGLSLKPTPNSMDTMKCDMAGAAVVASTIYNLALNNVPLWVIGLMPATDNRPDGNATTPGDIIKMHNGLHVEVLNTDAEGRLILADALSYAQNYNPQLLISIATLTGSAVMAIGNSAAVIMGNANKTDFDTIIESGEITHERLVQFPFWDDYAESLKSTVADLKNIGNREAGAISAGKFLEHFTTTKFIHIDIAGPAFLTSETLYGIKGATGFGVRLLSKYFNTIATTN